MNFYKEIKGKKQVVSIDNDIQAAAFKNGGWKQEAEATDANPLYNLSVEALKSLAAEKGINIGNSTSINGIAKKLIEAGVVCDGGDK